MRVEKSRAKKPRPHKRETMWAAELPWALNSFSVPEPFHYQPTFPLHGLRKSPFPAIVVSCNAMHVRHGIGKNWIRFLVLPLTTSGCSDDLFNFLEFDFLICKREKIPITWSQCKKANMKRIYMKLKTMSCTWVLNKYYCFYYYN